MIAGGFDHGTAQRWLEEGRADLIAFRRKFLANPDLPERLRLRTRLEYGVAVAPVRKGT